MTDICLVVRSGEHLDISLRKTLFTMAHYMIDADARYLSFEGVSRHFEASMTTDLKTGHQDGTTGIIFHAYIEYPNGRSTEATFLVNYRKDWREACVERLEIEKIPDLSAGLPEVWKN